MHCHVSLFEGDKNLFFDAKADHHLSKTARHFTAGLLTHVSEITAVLNQWVNSYKRLVPGYEAPVYISWGQRNRSSLVRIPGYRVGKEKATRIELRSPDPSANPYLTFALILAAGMKGIDKQMELGKPVETNIFEMDAAEKAKHKIDSLPGSLLDAINLLENSKLAKDTLGEHIHGKFIENKKMEWDEFRIHVSKYELENYLPEL
jgi:glutamine synthetase